MKLNDKQCKHFKPKAKAYKKSDGGGLYLEIMPSGSKYWRLKYRFAGKEKRLAIGTYPNISLQEARQARDEAKKKRLFCVNSCVALSVYSGYSASL